MTQIRDGYLHAAGSAVALLRNPVVVAAWDAPSALPKLTVSGLAGHLATQILMVPPTLTEPVPDGEPAGLLDHYTLGRWIGAGLDDEFNVTIRRAGAETAAAGATALAERCTRALAGLQEILPAQPADLVVRMVGRSWSLRLDDFLTTRLMEIAVHMDDLAVSAGIETPQLPEPVLDEVLSLLSRLAVRRHGATAVLRAFSRAERAPESIAAL